MIYFKHMNDNIKKYDPKEVRMGFKVESEHSNNRLIQRSILLAHLSEDRKYYTKLKKAGL